MNFKKVPILRHKKNYIQIFFRNNKSQINFYKKLLNKNQVLYQQQMILTRKMIIKSIPSIRKLNNKNILIRLTISKIKIN